MSYAGGPPADDYTRAYMRYHGCFDAFELFTARSTAAAEEIVVRLSLAPWGSATSSSDDDDWAVLQFIEMLPVSDGLPAKTMILGDYTGAVSRWEALTVYLAIQNPYESFSDDEQVEAKAALEMVDYVTHRRMSQAQIDIVGHPLKAGILGRRRIKKQMEAFRYPDLNALVLSIVDGMVLTELEPKSDPRVQQWTWEAASHHQRSPNPYLPILDVYERGVVPNWVDWQYMNFRGESLGMMPEPLL